jgi:hypothetical protein
MRTLIRFPMFLLTLILFVFTYIVVSIIIALILVLNVPVALLCHFGKKYNKRRNSYDGYDV